jgi:tetratricopeptide (TPR) repeat protein
MRAAFFLIVGTALFFAACSTAPKRPVEVFAVRNMAVNQLDLANKAADQGRYGDALLLLEEARRLAVSVDDPTLRIRTSLARGNIGFSMGNHEEAFAAWDAAREEAEKAGEGELTAAAGIYISRGRLILLSKSGASPEALEELRLGVTRHISLIKSDFLSTALGWITLGLIYKEEGLYPEAEDAFGRALVIHGKNRYLEEAAYDWYLIASVRSVAGRCDEAAEALETAIAFDRRAENGYGLAADWSALGEVYAKAGKTAESGAAKERAAAIFKSIGLDDSAGEVKP